MTIYETGYDLLSPTYSENTEKILKKLVRSRHRIAKATLHGKPVYIVVDFLLAKDIFEDSENFSIVANTLSQAATLTDGTQAFIDAKLASPLVAARHDHYRETRKIFNQALKHSYLEHAASIDADAKQRIEDLLDNVDGKILDVLALCRQYWLPLMAEIIGMTALSFAELNQLARHARTLVDGTGQQGDRDAVEQQILVNREVIKLITVASRRAANDSALGYLLAHLDEPTAIDMTRAFILGGMDTGANALLLQTRLLVNHRQQRLQFLALSEREQQQAVSELIAKDGPAYYSPRFALRDIQLEGTTIPAGSFFQLPSYALNGCANPDFDIRRADKSACPMHRHATFPFGHARHKCPGEMLARHLSAVFLNSLFSRYNNVGIDSFRMEPGMLLRSIGKFTLRVEAIRSTKNLLAGAKISVSRTLTINPRI
jgi:cytochrome P450